MPIYPPFCTENVKINTLNVEMWWRYCQYYDWAFRCSVHIITVQCTVYRVQGTGQLQLSEVPPPLFSRTCHYVFWWETSFRPLLSDNNLSVDSGVISSSAEHLCREGSVMDPRREKRIRIQPLINDKLCTFAINYSWNHEIELSSLLQYTRKIWKLLFWLPFMLPDLFSVFSVTMRAK